MDLPGLFGDNQAITTQSASPHLTLQKRWNALSCHRVHEAVAGGWLWFEHITGMQNPADILSKPLPHNKASVFTDPLLFWKGETETATVYNFPLLNMVSPKAV